MWSWLYVIWSEVFQTTDVRVPLDGQLKNALPQFITARKLNPSPSQPSHLVLRNAISNKLARKCKEGLNIQCFSQVHYIYRRATVLKEQRLELDVTTVNLF
jgi:hypothetical protein